jgi:predicted double-glycine peptidase
MAGHPNDKGIRPLATAIVVAAAAAGGCRAVTESAVSTSADPSAQTAQQSEVFQSVGNGFQVRQSIKSWRDFQRDNVVIQRLDYSCGSAALATLLRYYFEDDVGEQEVLETIFARLRRSENPQAELKDRIENGFSMLDLLNASKDLGYLGAVVRIPIAKLAQSQAPVIVRIEKYGYKHFVVFRGIHDDTVYLADPIRGNVRLSVQEFLDQWSGESLFLGKTGFGLPEDFPMALRVRGPARPELQVARQALFPVK